MTKEIYTISTTNIIHNDERLNVLPPRLGIRQGCTLPPVSLSIVLEVVDSAIKQVKKIKGIPLGRKKKVFLFADNMIIYMELQ